MREAELLAISIISMYNTISRMKLEGGATIKKRIGLIITIAIAVLIGGLLIWRFWPQPVSSLISFDESEVTGFSSLAMVGRFENGQSYTDTYRIDRTEMPGDEPGELAEILATTRYQQDFRNLWLWGIDSVGSDKYYDGRTVTLNFYFQDAENKYTEIMFLSPGIVVVRAEKLANMRIYHPTNRETLDKLVEYVQAHGVKQ